MPWHNMTVVQPNCYAYCFSNYDNEIIIIYKNHIFTVIQLQIIVQHYTLCFFVNEIYN